MQGKGVGRGEAEPGQKRKQPVGTAEVVVVVVVVVVVEGGGMASAVVEERAARAAVLESAVQTVPEGKLADNARLRLVRMLRREGRFLERLRGGELRATIARLASSNLTHVEVLLAWLSSEIVSGVTDVMVNAGNKQKNSKKADAADDEDDVDDGDKRTVHIDIIGLVDGRVTWVVIFGGRLQPEALRVRVFDAKLQRLLQAASSANVAHRPVRVLLHFAQGAPAVLAELLRKDFEAFPWEHSMAVSSMPAGEVWCIDCSAQLVHRGLCGAFEVLQTSGADEEELDCDVQRIKLGKEASVSGVDESCEHHHGKSGLVLDTTAMIAYVSDITNGGAASIAAMPDDERKDRFRNSAWFMHAQALSELEAPLLPELELRMQDRMLLVPESTLREYHNIISTIAGPRERQRSDELLQCMQCVADTPSSRITALRASSRVQQRHKVVFGTADTLRLPVLSANTSFVRAAHQAGVPVNVLLHRPRALSGE